MKRGFHERERKAGLLRREHDDSSLTSISARQSRFFARFFRMSPAWPLQEAKNKLSEWIDKAVVEGAQSITRHGRPVAVVVSAETYSRLQPAETLADILLDSLGVCDE